MFNKGQRRRLKNNCDRAAGTAAEVATKPRVVAIFAAILVGRRTRIGNYRAVMRGHIGRQTEVRAGVIAAAIERCEMRMRCRPQRFTMGRTRRANRRKGQGQSLQQNNDLFPGNHNMASKILSGVKIVATQPAGVNAQQSQALIHEPTWRPSRNPGARIAPVAFSSVTWRFTRKTRPRRRDCGRAW